MPKTLIIKENQLTAGGGTINLDVTEYGDLYRLYSSGSVTLTGSYTIQSTGTAVRGMEFLFHYTADLDFDGNTLTIMGASIPSYLSAINMYIRAYYTGSAWEVTLAPDFESSNFITDSALAADSVTSSEIATGAVDTDELASDAVTTVKILDQNVTTAKIDDDAITTVKILDANVTEPKLANGAVTVSKVSSEIVDSALVFDTSYETNEQTTIKVRFPFDATINSAFYVVSKAVAATDDGSVSFAINGSAMTPSSNTNSAGEAIGNSKLVTFTSGNTISAGETLEFTSAKTTAGGKLTWTIYFTKT